jgi:arylsulfatase A-like enzyme
MTIRIAALVLILAGAAAPQDAPRRPNILLCIADDWGWPHAGAYGDPVVKTPHFDRVAREGVLFRQAFASSPSCTPSRNALLSGQWHWRLGPGANLHSTWDEKTPVYPLLLQAAGYHVGHWRKSFGPGRLDNWKEHPAGRNYPKGFGEFLAARPSKDAPFCFWMGSSDPHREYDPGSGARSGIDPSKIRLFPHLPDAPEVRSDVADYYFEVQRFDSDVGKALAELERIGELEHTIVAITSDNGMPFPRCKANLYDSGNRMPLAIRWGQAVRGGRETRELVSTTDLAPTFLEAAGVPVPPVMTGRSLLPILRGAPETAPRPFVLMGKERHTPGQERPSMGGTPMRAIRTQDHLYIRNYEPDRWPAGSPDHELTTRPGAWLSDCDNGPTKSYMDEHREKDGVHRRAWDLAFAKRPSEELYDLRSDPDQLTNVAGDAAQSATRAALAKLLEDELRRTGDPRVVGGAERFDEYPYFGGAPRHPKLEKR